MDAATVWADVFSTLTVSEQSCIRDAVGDERLEGVLDRLVLETSDTPEDWVVSITSLDSTPNGVHQFFWFVWEGVVVELAGR